MFLLSSYNRDNPKEEYGIPNEYDDTLPLLLEYLYLKYANKEDEFSIKHLNELKGFQVLLFFYYYYDFENCLIILKKYAPSSFANSPAKQKQFKAIYDYFDIKKQKRK